jgi:hypothetical protein
MQEESKRQVEDSLEARRLVRELQDAGVTMGLVTTESRARLASQLNDSGLQLSDFAVVRADCSLQLSGQHSTGTEAVKTIAVVKEVIEELSIPISAALVISSSSLDAATYRKAGEVDAFYSLECCTVRRRALDR